MKFLQFISDIHLELGIPVTKKGEVLELPPKCYEQIIKKDPKADILVLAGDIGKLRPDTLSAFIDYCCGTWTDVIYVPGNHEFYDKKNSRETIVLSLQELTLTRPNLHFLDRGIVTIQSQRFLGCCLWSKPLSKDGLNDFHWISHQLNPTTRHPIGASDMARWHQADLDWLSENLQEGDIVVTHFMPLTNLDLIQSGHQSLYPPSQYDNYYGNMDCWDLFKRKPKLWISGHTHQTFDVLVPLDEECSAEVRWVCNPAGYPGEEVGEAINNVFEF